MSPIKMSSVTTGSVVKQGMSSVAKQALEEAAKTPHAIGAIRDKWLELGGEKGFLGRPLTNELQTADGVGRYNQFQHGLIYWTNATGAHEVHGDIRKKWVSLGSERSFLGYPVSDEVDFSEGGRVSVFQNGSIYWWPDTGAIELKGVIVHYTGLICFGETNEASSSDEPYAILSATTASQRPTTRRTQVYEGVDGGESRPDLLEIYRGAPWGMALNVVLMEHDEGDPNKYRDLVKSAVDSGFDQIKTALPYIPIVGPILAIVGPPILDAVAPSVTDEINGLLGTGDDVIGQTTIQLSPRQMVLLAARTNNSTERGVGFKVATPLLSGGGASYKVYFGLIPA